STMLLPLFIHFIYTSPPTSAIYTLSLHDALPIYLIDGLKQIPGVRKVGATSGLPLLEGGLPNGMFLLMTQNEMPKTPDGFGSLGQQKERLGSADFGVVTDGYFQVLGIPLIRGRIFDERDGPDSPHVAVISESLARD